jgi:hypothetical protein
MGLPARKQATQFQIDRSDMGKADTLRFNVLSYVVEENYDRAIETLIEFRDKDSDYPKFKERTERYVSHAIDLVNAIRAKRNFPGMKSLTVAKQQELGEKFASHFHELQYALKKIEKIQVDVRIDDVRSTVWIIKALMHAALAVMVIAFALDVSHGLFNTTAIVLDDFFQTLTSMIFGKVF